MITTRLDYSRRFRGTLINELTGYPLSGLHLKLYSIGPHLGGENKKSYIAEAVTNSRGDFDIILQDSLFPANLFSISARQQELYIVVDVETLLLNRYTLTDFIRMILSSEKILISVTVPFEEVSLKTWKDLGSRLQESSITQLNDIIRHLVFLPQTQSVFGDWSLKRKQSVAAELERAFLDPDAVLRSVDNVPTIFKLRTAGFLEEYSELMKNRSPDIRMNSALRDMKAKVNSFDNIYNVDWIIDLNQLIQGNIGKAITTKQSYYMKSGNQSAQEMAGPIAKIGIEKPVGFADEYLVPYRDYLRNIFTGPKSSSSYSNYG